MAREDRGSFYILFVVIIIIIIIAPIDGTTSSSYWQTVVNKQSSDFKTHSKKICFPKTTHTKETLGHIVSKNSTTVCIENTLVVKQISDKGWTTDFQAKKGFLKVIITSGSGNLMANLLSNFVIFVSDTALKHDKDYSSYKALVEECTRHKGHGFKPNEKMTFTCKKVVHGRYFYIWGLGTQRIHSDSIGKIEFQFAITVIKAPNKSNLPKQDNGKDFMTIFTNLSPWGAKKIEGYWVVLLGKVYMIESVLIGVEPSHVATLGQVIVDVGTNGKSHRAVFSGDKKSVLSADKKSFFVTIHLEGNAARIKGSKGKGYLSQKAVKFVEMMVNDGKKNLFFKNIVKLSRTTKIEVAIRKQVLKGCLQVWQDGNVEVTGWLMIDMQRRYQVMGVSITSGSNPEVVNDLQGLVIATSNFIPDKDITQSEKLELDICAVVGPKVEIVAKKEGSFKCLPKPLLGVFVLIYNDEKPLRLSAIRKVKVFILLEKAYFLEFKVPDFPRIPKKPPISTLPIIPFFATTHIVDHLHNGYWVVDLLSVKKVTAVVVVAGKACYELKSFVIYVQDVFIEDFNSVCASFMSKVSLSGKGKYFACKPQTMPGRYVIISSLQTYIKQSISVIEVWFVEGREHFYASPKLFLDYPAIIKPDTSLPKEFDFVVIYPSIAFSVHPKGWLMIDLIKKYMVVGVELELLYKPEVLKTFREVFVGLTALKSPLKTSICAYRLSRDAINKRDATTFCFQCSTPYQYRYIIIRAHKACTMIPLETVKMIRIIIKIGNRNRYFRIDVTEVSRLAYVAKLPWKATNPVDKKHSNKQGDVYEFDLKKPVDVALVEITVKKDIKANNIDVILNNVESYTNGVKTCYWFTSRKGVYIYEGSKYKLRCSYRSFPNRYVFIMIRQNDVELRDYLKSVKIIIKDSNEYYHYKWPKIPLTRGERFGNTSIPWFLHLGWKTEVFSVTLTTDTKIEKGFKIAVFSQTLLKVSFPIAPNEICYDMKKPLKKGKTIVMKCKSGVKGVYLYPLRPSFQFDPAAIKYMKVSVFEPKSVEGKLKFKASQITSYKTISANMISCFGNNDTNVTYSLRKDKSIGYSWLKVDLIKSHIVSHVSILNPYKRDSATLTDFALGLVESLLAGCSYQICHHYKGPGRINRWISHKCYNDGAQGRYLIIWSKRAVLKISGIEVYGRPAMTLEFSYNYNGNKADCSRMTKRNIQRFERKN